MDREYDYDDVEQPESDDNQGSDDRYSAQDPSHNTRSQGGRNQLWEKGKEKAKEKAAQRTREELAKQFRKKAANRAAKGATKQVGKRAVQAGAAATGPGAAVALGIELVDQGQQFVRNPKKTMEKWGKWALLFILIFLFIIILFFGSIFIIIAAILGLEDKNCTPGTQANPLTLSATAPSVKNGEDLNITIDAAYNGTLQELTITHKLADGTEFKSADNGGQYDKASNTVTWKLNANKTVSLTLKAIKDNTHVIGVIKGDARGTPAEGSGGNGGAGCVCEEGQPLKLSVLGPESAKNGAELNYKIDPSYRGTLNELTITYTIPEGMEFKSADNGGKHDKAANTVTWKLNTNKAVSLVLKATKDKNDAIGIIKADAKGTPTSDSDCAGGGGGGLPGDLANNVPPSTNDCGGKWRRYISMLTGDKKGKNYGDPECNFTKDKLAALLKQLDPASAKIWFCIAQHETGYDPNGYNPNSTSGHGAFGNYQMNPPGKGNGEYDNGYVVWTLQASNAINYRNKVVKGDWSYWQPYNEGKCR